MRPKGTNRRAATLTALLMLGCAAKEPARVDPVTQPPPAGPALLGGGEETRADLREAGRPAGKTAADDTRSARGGPQPASGPVSPAERRRMVIRNASVEVRSEDPTEVAARAARVAEAASGFVVSSESSGVGEGVTRVAVTLRVPAEQFEPVLSQLRALGVPLHESITGQDVTEEYTDIEAQLTAQRELERRFFEILSKATTVEDTLKVEGELARVRMEIERLEGRRRFLADQAALSTIHLTASSPYQPTAAEAETFGSRMSNALGDAGENFVEVLAGAVRLFGGLVPLALLFAPLALVWRAVRRRRAAKAEVRRP